MEQQNQKIFETDQDTNSLKSNTLRSFLNLERSEFEDEKDFKKFIKSVERIVRASPEYHEFISFTRESLDANVCSFTGETEEETGDVELHHYPLTLFDIVQIVIDEKIYNNEKFTSFDIAKEVLTLHYTLKIGFVPLIGTLHKKYHKGNLQIPIEFVIGDYQYLAKNYNIAPELRNKILEAAKLNVNNVPRLEWTTKIVHQQKEEEIQTEDQSEEDAINKMVNVLKEL